MHGNVRLFIDFDVEPIVIATQRMADAAMELLERLVLRERATAAAAELRRLVEQLVESAPTTTFPASSRTRYQAFPTGQRRPANPLLSGLRSLRVTPRARERRPMRSRPGTKRRTA